MNSSGAIILAGGQSSRMGQDKASIVVDGQSMLERLIRVVSPLTTQVVVMLSASQQLPPISDEFESLIDIGRDSQAAQGPLQGIADALPLLHPEIDNLFILSCDLPHLTTDVLTEMKQLLTSDIDGVCAQVNGKDNPLLAVYQRRVISNAVRPSAAGRTCMVLIDDHQITRISPPPGTPLVFSDMNTPAAFETARRQLQEKRP